MCTEYCLCTIPIVCSSLLAVKDLLITYNKKEYWSGLPFSPSGDLLDPAIEPTSLVSVLWHVDSLPLSHPGSPLYCSKNFKRREREIKEVDTKDNTETKAGS